MRFADYAKLYLTAGDGGNGSTHFRREKFVPKGGPDGGDGGRGGHIILRGNSNLSTILDLRYRKFIKAKPGSPGSGSRSSGKGGEDVILEVPLGTQVFEAETRKVLGEVMGEGQELIVAKGGDGGLGNWHFKSSTNQTPRRSTNGFPGQEIVVELELKLIADVGLVGFPNAGKSTLLTALSSARPKIADYPFTTLEPNLGVVQLLNYRSFVMADIPGIIEDAHQGKGLGIRFLRHIERNSVLLFVISALENVEKEYAILLNELERFDPLLLKKPRLIAINKMDTQADYQLETRPEIPDDLMYISAVTAHGLDHLKEQLWTKIHG